MNSVLVGMFDTEAAAVAARSKLMAAGFADGALQMTGGSEIFSTSASPTTAPHHEGAISRFFENLFGDDDGEDDLVDHHRTTYTEAFKRGSYGLTVRTASVTEMDRAEEILKRSRCNRRRRTFGRMAQGGLVRQRCSRVEPGDGHGARHGRDAKAAGGAGATERR